MDNLALIWRHVDACRVYSRRCRRLLRGTDVEVMLAHAAEILMRRMRQRARRRRRK